MPRCSNGVAVTIATMRLCLCTQKTGAKAFVRAPRGVALAQARLSGLTNAPQGCVRESAQSRTITPARYQNMGGRREGGAQTPPQPPSLERTGASGYVYFSYLRWPPRHRQNSGHSAVFRSKSMTMLCSMCIYALVST